MMLATEPLRHIDKDNTNLSGTLVYNVVEIVCGPTEEIRKRTELARKRDTCICRSRSHMENRALSRYTKLTLQLLKTFLFPVLLYGAKTCTIKQEKEQDAEDIIVDG